MTPKEFGLAAQLRQAHDLCKEHRDMANASLLETWIDQTEQRTWLLFEASRTEVVNTR